MKVTRGELKELIAEELEATLNEQRPEKQRKPWGPDPYTGKNIRWGGKGAYQDRQDWSAGHPGEPEERHDDDMYVNRSKVDKVWAQAASEVCTNMGSDKDVWSAAGVDCSLDGQILMQGWKKALPDSVRLTLAMQDKYTHYYKKLTGNWAKCGNYDGPNLFGEWSGPCAEGPSPTDEEYPRPWMNKDTPEYEHYKETGSFKKDGVSFFESVSNDDLERVITEELEAALKGK